MPYSILNGSVDLVPERELRQAGFIFKDYLKIRQIRFFYQDIPGLLPCKPCTDAHMGNNRAPLVVREFIRLSHVVTSIAVIGPGDCTTTNISNGIFLRMGYSAARSGEKYGTKQD